MIKKKAFFSSLQIFLCELIGMALYMFYGCLGLISTSTALEAAVVLGFIYSSIIMVFSHLSGAHVNPSVTLCFLLLDTISPLIAVVYVIAQLLGGILGIFLLKALVPEDLYRTQNAKTPCGFCSTCVNPEVTLLRAFMLEFLLTAVLILVTCAASDPRNKNINDSLPIKLAFFCIMGALSVGPFTGASMNPARSLAPAIVNNKGWQDHWLYWVAPLSSSIIITLGYKYIILWPYFNNELEDSPPPATSHGVGTSQTS